MSILWMGGEDVDFPNTAASITINLSTNNYRAGFSRCGIYLAITGQIATSKAFSGSPVSTFWATWRVTTWQNPAQSLGVCQGSSGKGIIVGADASGHTTLHKWDGATLSTLATETGISSPGISTTPTKMDLHVIGWGATAAVSVYVGNFLVISWTGDLSFSGAVTGIDSAFMRGGGLHAISEIVVADEDTRPCFGVVTMAPNANGTTDSWSNTAYTNVNGNPPNDLNPVYTNTAAQDEQFNLVNEPVGLYMVKGVKISARAYSPPGSTATKLKLGFDSGGSVAVDAGQAAATYPYTLESYFATNPVTGVDWGGSTEMNALQVNLQSAS